MYQRSADAFLGLPNIASYALLTHILAHVTGLRAAELVIALGDVPLNLNHIDKARLQLTRAPRALPRLRIPRIVADIDDFRANDLIIEGYHPHPRISATVSV